MENHFKVAHELGKPSRMWECRFCLIVLDGLRIRRHKCGNSYDLVPETPNSTSSNESGSHDNSLVAPPTVLSTTLQTTLGYQINESLKESRISEQSMPKSAVCIPSPSVEQSQTLHQLSSQSLATEGLTSMLDSNSNEMQTTSSSPTNVGNAERKRPRLRSRTTAQP